MRARGDAVPGEAGRGVLAGRVVAHRGVAAQHHADGRHAGLRPLPVGAARERAGRAERGGLLQSGSLPCRRDGRLLPHGHLHHLLHQGARPHAARSLPAGAARVPRPRLHPHPSRGPRVPAGRGGGSGGDNPLLRPSRGLFRLPLARGGQRAQGLGLVLLAAPPQGARRTAESRRADPQQQRVGGTAPLRAGQAGRGERRVGAGQLASVASHRRHERCDCVPHGGRRVSSQGRADEAVRAEQPARALLRGAEHGAVRARGRHAGARHGEPAPAGVYRPPPSPELLRDCADGVS